MKISLSCLSLVALGALMLTSDGARAADTRSYTGGRFLLSVAGTPVGYLKSFDGGTVVGDVVPESARPASFPKKHLGGTHVEPVVAETGIQAGPLMAWVTETLAGTFNAKAVTLTTADFNSKDTGRTEFDRTRLLQVEFPRLDGAGKEYGVMRLTLQPDGARRFGPSGADMRNVLADKSRTWLTSNFRVTVAGLPTDRVVSVEPITVKVAGGSLVVSNLVLAIAQADYKPWQDWHDAFVASRQEAADALEKTGTIDLLDADLKTVIGRISLRGLGSVRVSSGKQQTGAEAVPRFTAEMYVEDVKFALDSAVRK